MFTVWFKNQIRTFANSDEPKCKRLLDVLNEFKEPYTTLYFSSDGQVL